MWEEKQKEVGQLTSELRNVRVKYNVPKFFVVMLTAACRLLRGQT